MSGEPIGIHNVGNWTAGKSGGCVVSDQLGGNVPGGDTFDEYYGGYLIAESIGRSNVPIIAAAPDMLKALVAVRRAISGFGSLGVEKVLIDTAIAKATTPIAPVLSPVITEPVVPYEDIDQHDVFIDGDQFLNSYPGAGWQAVWSELGKRKCDSELSNRPCRRPVKQAPVEPVPEQACCTEKAKPPIGIMSKQLWLEARRDDLYAVISRYHSSLNVVPVEWLEELVSLEREIQYETCDIDCGYF